MTFVLVRRHPRPLPLPGSSHFSCTVIPQAEVSQAHCCALWLDYKVTPLGWKRLHDTSAVAFSDGSSSGKHWHEDTARWLTACYLLAEKPGCFDQTPPGSCSVGVREQRWAESFFLGAISWGATHSRNRCRGCIAFLLDDYSVWSDRIWLNRFYSIW